MEDKIFRVKMSGQILKQALENGVSMWPKYDGRFPLTSGIFFSFDPSREKGDKVIAESMRDINGETIILDKIYTCAIKQYMASGKDGYTILLDPSIEYLQPSIEDAPTIQEIFINWFNSFHKTS